MLDSAENVHQDTPVRQKGVPSKVTVIGYSGDDSDSGSFRCLSWLQSFNFRISVQKEAMTKS